MTVTYEWRGAFVSREANVLHAEAFGTREFTDSEWDWAGLVSRHSLGWVVARTVSSNNGDSQLAGFLNVLWDGSAHAWLQDVMVAASARHLGIGTALVEVARREAKAAGCEWLHVDFDAGLAPFYYEACGFRPTNAGVIALD